LKWPVFIDSIILFLSLLAWALLIIFLIDFNYSNSTAASFKMQMRRTTINKRRSPMLVRNWMSQPVITVDKKDSNKLVGVITQTDLFKAFVSLTGIKKRGIHFGMVVDDRPGSIMEVANRIHSAGGRMVSLMASYEGAEKGKRKLYIRIIDLKREILEELKQQLQSVAKLIYLIDLRENNRRLYF
jgi:hypothetical protein